MSSLSNAIYECYFSRAQKTVLPTEFLRSWAFACSEGVLFIGSLLYTDALIPAWQRLDKHRVIQVESLMKKPPDMFATPDQKNYVHLRCDMPFPEELSTVKELAPFRKLILELPPWEEIRWMVVCVQFDNGSNLMLLCDPETGKIELVACSTVLVKFEVGHLRQIEDTVSWFSLYLLHKRLVVQTIVVRELEYCYCTILSLYYLRLRLSQELPLREAGLLLTSPQVLKFLSTFVESKHLSQRQRTAQDNCRSTLYKDPHSIALYILEQCGWAADMGLGSMEFKAELGEKGEAVYNILIDKHLNVEKLYTKQTVRICGYKIQWGEK
jgi:hypothetical protein